MQRPRVAITGIGTVSSNGHDLDRFWNWICSAPPGPVVRRFDTFDPSPWMTPKEIKRSDRFTHYGVPAAHLAIADAGLDPATIDPRRGGVVMSTLYGATLTIEEESARFDPDARDAVPAFLGMACCENLVAAMTSQHLGWRGPSKVVVTACASGTHAVSEGADLIRSGRCQAVVAGGAQGRVMEIIVSAFENLRLLSPSGWVRPFDVRRDGFAHTEGAAMLVLEDLDAARARGARIYAEVWGSGHTNDADSLISPSGSGAVECMTAALDDAEADPSEIVHVNAHGTGTGLNDRREAEALHEVFGSTPPPVTSVKRVLGHVTGASGAFEAAASALTVHHRVIPSLGTDVEPDPDLDLDLVIGDPRPVAAGPVLSNSFGIGGHNGCIVIGPPRG
ncbi:MAG: beta-ketoacyl-[acyl-carrier-protein] synthase family protein [Acidimicrobiales bacterium]|nr:beta-ketoacyl-[acyl-carrier-protein] synthase family protein [Acidimicrobiales bacterium]